MVETGRKKHPRNEKRRKLIKKISTQGMLQKKISLKRRSDVYFDFPSFKFSSKRVCERLFKDFKSAQTRSLQSEININAIFLPFRSGDDFSRLLSPRKTPKLFFLVRLFQRRHQHYRTTSSVPVWLSSCRMPHCLLSSALLFLSIFKHDSIDFPR